ncbi:MAG: hypothetical protein KGH64_01335 [Candidatus Micrarchaeota archaeon]|nr:hypothetical protein [Candidatus Micrarchaeota archaeon]MDE1833960.1 hypothetical protein [Candidatus Micrarchaeota archaeon]MDE1859772.1 hypothetical protein [Candidatus Micrarchaeota archaeon]
MMIYAGYEQRHYFVRFTHNMRLAYLAGIFQDGYKFVWQHMLLVKRRRAGSYMQ